VSFDCSRVHGWWWRSTSGARASHSNWRPDGPMIAHRVVQCRRRPSPSSVSSLVWFVGRCALRGRDSSGPTVVYSSPLTVTLHIYRFAFIPLFVRLFAPLRFMRSLIYLPQRAVMEISLGHTPEPGKRLAQNTSPFSFDTLNAPSASSYTFVIRKDSLSKLLKLMREMTSYQ
jgi:hypothetical protein